MSSVAEKANSRVTMPSTLRTNTISPLSSSLILLVSGLPLCLGLLDKGLFEVHNVPPLRSTEGLVHSLAPAF